MKQCSKRESQQDARKRQPSQASQRLLQSMVERKASKSALPPRSRAEKYVLAVPSSGWAAGIPYKYSKQYDQRQKQSALRTDSVDFLLMQGVTSFGLSISSF